ncbi:MAG: maleylacetoacetate isomerase [Rickettsiales bacterium]|jgi:maleylacetoacetate isomerase
MNLKLYTRYQNSAGQRVRTALNLKGADYEYVGVTMGVEPGWSEYRRTVNPQGLLPTLEVDGRRVVQSTAIIEYIEENLPGPSLLPEDPVSRAQSRGFAQVIACEMHAVVVSRLRALLGSRYELSEEQVLDWRDYWYGEGFGTLEELLRQRETATPFCFDDKPTLADIYLVPQMYNFRRDGADLSPYPLLREIDERCRALPAFEKAMPENQPDWPG